MAYYTNLFSPETYEAFSRSDKTISGFRTSQHVRARKIHPGDKLVCYMTKLARWIGVLEVVSECFVDEQPVFYSERDSFVVRFRVKPLVWLVRLLFRSDVGVRTTFGLRDEVPTNVLRNAKNSPALRIARPFVPIGSDDR